MARGRKKKTSYSGAELIQEYQKLYKVAEAKKELVEKKCNVHNLQCRKR